MRSLDSGITTTGPVVVLPWGGDQGIIASAHPAVLPPGRAAHGQG